MHQAHSDCVLQGQGQGVSVISQARDSVWDARSRRDRRWEAHRRPERPQRGRVGCRDLPGALFRTAAVLCSAVLIAFASATASAATSCGSVSYTIPNTHGEGHAALNDLVAINVSCRIARSVAKAFLVTGKAPKRWRGSTKTVVTHANGATNTVSEEIFTRHTSRVTGDIAN